MGRGLILGGRDTAGDPPEPDWNSDQPGGGLGERDAAEFDEFVAGGVAAKEFDLAAAALQFFGQQAEQGFIGGGIHRRGGDANAEFLTQGAEDFVGGSPGL